MNILFITADEMRGDCTGYIGNPDVKTPHLDQLASRPSKNFYIMTVNDFLSSTPMAA